MKCPYKDKCSDAKDKCAKCQFNDSRRSYFVPVHEHPTDTGLPFGTYPQTDDIGDDLRFPNSWGNADSRVTVTVNEE